MTWCTRTGSSRSRREQAVIDRRPSFSAPRVWALGGLKSIESSSDTLHYRRKKRMVRVKHLSSQRIMRGGLETRVCELVYGDGYSCRQTDGRFSLARARLAQLLSTAVTWASRALPLSTVFNTTCYTADNNMHTVLSPQQVHPQFQQYCLYHKGDMLNE